MKHHQKTINHVKRAVFRDKSLVKNESDKIEPSLSVYFKLKIYYFFEISFTLQSIFRLLIMKFKAAAKAISKTIASYQA